MTKKVLGNDPDLGPKDVERILSKGMAQLRARRKLRLQVPERRMAELLSERPNLVKAIQGEPDLLIEGVDDVGVGFARVVTEIGGALCAEEAALDVLSQAVNVREAPRAARAGDGREGTAPGRTDVGTRPNMIPNAALSEDEGNDETLNIAPTRRAPAPRSIDSDDVEEIAAVEEDGSAVVTRPPNRVPTGQVQAPQPQRGATRVVPIGADKSRAKVSRIEDDDGSDETMRAQRVPAVSDDASAEDEDLDLFTDDAVGSRKKRR